MRRWSEHEQNGLDIIRARLGPELATVGQFPDTVGDRKLLRFLRGHGHDIDVACDMISKYITWRRTNDVDRVRSEILHGGCNHPSLFPHGEKILKLIPQIVIDHNIRDTTNSPIVFEQFNFRPADVLAEISVEEYVVFVTYSLEFRSLILEHLSEEQEQEKLQQLKLRMEAGEDLSNEEPYGTTCHLCIIRDLGGVGFDHLGSQGQDIIKAIIGVAANNYPELMRKCHMVNVPWLFHTVWWVIKGWLPAKTIEKISVVGAGFLPHLTAEIPLDCIPIEVGGNHSKPVEPFNFDISKLSSLPCKI